MTMIFIAISKSINKVKNFGISIPTSTLSMNLAMMITLVNLYVNKMIFDV
ncbi:MAG: hypothetical protein QXL96_02445 [Ignisphaera sp.]